MTITETVSALLEEMGVPSMDIRLDAKLLDLIVDEDATFWFIPAVQAQLQLKVPLSDWERVVTVKDVIDVLERHVSRW